MSPDIGSLNNTFCKMYVEVTYGVRALNPSIAVMLPHNRFLLAGSLSLSITLSNALTTSIIRLFNSEVLKAFEHPLKIMLMLLRILVEISKQYGSK